MDSGIFNTRTCLELCYQVHYDSDEQVSEQAYNCFCILWRGVQSLFVDMNDQKLLLALITFPFLLW